MKKSTLAVSALLASLASAPMVTVAYADDHAAQASTTCAGAAHNCSGCSGCSGCAGSCAGSCGGACAGASSCAPANHCAGH